MLSARNLLSHPARTLGGGYHLLRRCVDICSITGVTTTTTVATSACAFAAMACQHRTIFNSTKPRTYAAPPPPEDKASESEAQAEPVYVDVGAPPKPDSFAHKVSYQKNPDNRIDTPMRVYQSRQPTLLPQVHMHDSVADYLVDCCKAQDPEKVCSIQVETGDQLTYRQFLRRIRQVKSVLYNTCGVRKGDVVMLCMPNTINYAPVVLGASRLATIVSTSKSSVTDELLTDHLEASGAKVVITNRFIYRNVQKAALTLKKRSGTEVKIVLEETIMKHHVDDAPYYLHFTQDAKRDDVVLIPFSAGTSGQPRGVQLSNINLVSNIYQATQAFQLTRDDVHLAVLPFSHMLGLTLSVGATLAVGGTLVVMSAFNARSFLSAINKYNVTTTVVAPPIVNAITRTAAVLGDKSTYSSLRLLRSTGAPLSPEQWARVCEVLPSTNVGQMYGMTEMSPLALSTTISSPVGKPSSGTGGEEWTTVGASEVPVIKKKRRQNTSVVGALVADTEMRIVRVDDNQQSSVDASSGVDVEEGGEGEIWLRGPQRMVGFVDPLSTRAAIQDGWYRTGDIGYVDNGTGQLCMTDRLRELIRFKGFYISPAQVEKALAQCPEVGECVVIGVPDPRDASFEYPRALVKLAPDALLEDISKDEEAVALQGIQQRLIQHIETKLPSHKHLRGGVRFVNDIPKTMEGKLKRRAIREAEIELMKQGPLHAVPQQK